MTAQLHLAIDALTLQLLLERAQRLVDIIVANDDLHKSRLASFKLRARNRPGEPGARPGHPASTSLGNEYCRPCPLRRVRRRPLSSGTPPFQGVATRRKVRRTVARAGWTPERAKSGYRRL